MKKMIKNRFKENVKYNLKNKRIISKGGIFETLCSGTA